MDDAQANALPYGVDKIDPGNDVVEHHRRALLRPLSLRSTSSSGEKRSLLPAAGVAPPRAAAEIGSRFRPNCRLCATKHAKCAEVCYRRLIISLLLCCDMTHAGFACENRRG
jgi:hypothetical protein